MTLFCTIISLLFSLPAEAYAWLYGLVDLEPPDLSFGIGSIFGCNVP